MYIFSSGLDSLFVNLIGMMYQHFDPPCCRCGSSVLVCGPGIHQGTCIRYVASLSLRLIRLRADIHVNSESHLDTFRFFDTIFICNMMNILAYIYLRFNYCSLFRESQHHKSTLGVDYDIADKTNVINNIYY